MNSIRVLPLFLSLILLSGGCYNSPISEEETKPSEDDLIMKLFIDDNEMNVSWEENPSIDALKNLLPLTISMHEYGGFEQTGSIGKSIVRNDKQINVSPGDIVLYSGNAISVFYAPSQWSYTYLGHINMNEDELNDLLNKDSVIFSLKKE